MTTHSCVRHMCGCCTNTARIEVVTVRHCTSADRSGCVVTTLPPALLFLQTTNQPNCTKIQQTQPNCTITQHTKLWLATLLILLNLTQEHNKHICIEGVIPIKELWAKQLAEISSFKWDMCGKNLIHYILWLVLVSLTKTSNTKQYKWKINGFSV